MRYRLVCRDDRQTSFFYGAGEGKSLRPLAGNLGDYPGYPEKVKTDSRFSLEKPIFP